MRRISASAIKPDMRIRVNSSNQGIHEGTVYGVYWIRHIGGNGRGHHKVVFSDKFTIHVYNLTPVYSLED